jgi:hypothetical protein
MKMKPITILALVGLLVAGLARASPGQRSGGDGKPVQIHRCQTVLRGLQAGPVGLRHRQKTYLIPTWKGKYDEFRTWENV